METGGEGERLGRRLAEGNGNICCRLGPARAGLQGAGPALSHVRRARVVARRGGGGGVGEAVPREVHQLDAVRERRGLPRVSLLLAVRCMPATAAAAASCCTRDPATIARRTCAGRRLE